MSTTIKSTPSCTSWCPYKCAQTKLSKTTVVAASVAAVYLLGSLGLKMYKKYYAVAQPVQTVVKAEETVAEVTEETRAAPDSQI